MLGGGLKIGQGHSRIADGPTGAVADHGEDLT
jgi:hypothetical protein